MTTEINERIYTFAEFMALPDDGHRYELVDGRLVEMAGPSRRHGHIVIQLGSFLNEYAKQHDLGEVYTETAFNYFPDSPLQGRRPDISFVAKERLAGVDPDGGFTFAPDLAVKVVSPSDEWFEVVEKALEYRHYGVKLIWIVSSPDRSVWVYRQGSSIGVQVDSESKLTGGDVLPGFAVKVSAIFEMGG